MKLLLLAYQRPRGQNSGRALRILKHLWVRKQNLQLLHVYVYI